MLNQMSMKQHKKQRKMDIKIKNAMNIILALYVLSWVNDANIRYSKDETKWSMEHGAGLFSRRIKLNERALIWIRFVATKETLPIIIIERPLSKMPFQWH